MKWRQVALAVMAVGITLAPAVPAHATKTGDVVAAQPSPGSQIAPDGRYYRLNIKPGASLTQSFRVVNNNKHAVTVSVEAVDAQTSDSTGAVYGTPNSPKALTSRWLVVSRPQITLQPDEGRDIPFDVHVPANTQPGQYLAAMSAAVLITGETKDPNQRVGQRQAGFTVAVEPQRIVAVEIDVPGTHAPQLAVTGAEPKATSDGVSLAVHIANQGNGFAHGTGVIRVVDTKTDYSFKIDTFVSHTAIVYSMPWTKSVVAGLHHIQVDLNYEDGRRTSWTGTVDIAGNLKDQLENQLKTIQLHKGGSSLLLLLLAVLLLAGLIGGAIYIRRRDRQPAYVKYRPV